MSAPFDLQREEKAKVLILEKVLPQASALRPDLQSELAISANHLLSQLGNTPVTYSLVEVAKRKDGSVKHIDYAFVILAAAAGVVALTILTAFFSLVVSSSFGLGFLATLRALASSLCFLIFLIFLRKSWKENKKRALEEKNPPVTPLLSPAPLPELNEWCVAAALYYLKHPHEAELSSALSQELLKLKVTR